MTCEFSAGKQKTAEGFLASLRSARDEGHCTSRAASHLAGIYWPQRFRRAASGYLSYSPPVVRPASRRALPARHRRAPSTLTIGTMPTLAQGNYSLTVNAASGGITQTQNVQLTVGGMTGSISPSSATIAAGSFGNFAVSATSGGGFAGQLALSCSGVPWHTPYPAIEPAFRIIEPHSNDEVIHRSPAFSTVIRQGSFTRTIKYIYVRTPK